MDSREKKKNRYSRIIAQLSELFKKTDDGLARMATTAAVLHHKMDGFFWTGYYFLKNERLVVGPYQGPVACQELKPGTGVCHAAVSQRKTIVVGNVHEFPGHIACDSRSNSEIVVPVFDSEGKLFAVLDIDSTRLNNFDEIDTVNLEAIMKMIGETYVA